MAKSAKRGQGAQIAHGKAGKVSAASKTADTASANAISIRSTRAFAPFEWMLAGRYLRSRRKDTFISVIAGFSFAGIMLGVATLIIVMAVMNGFRIELFDRILGFNGHFIAHPSQNKLVDYTEVSLRLETVDGVKSALPVVEGQVLVTGNSGKGAGALVRGIKESDFKKVKAVSEPGKIKDGTLEGFEEKEGVAVGSRMARNLGLFLGDEITLVSPEGDITPFGTSPRVKAYPIVAIFEVGMSEYDSTVLFMPFKEAQLFFNQENEASFIEVFLDDPDTINEIRPKLSQTANRPIFLTDWTTRNRTFFSALEVERNVMFFILTLIVLVAALNIISGLFMLVKDKGRDIAIMRTMGASRGAVMRVFFMTGAAIGVFGTIAGFILGVVVVMNVEYIRQFFSWASGTTIFNPELYFLSQLPAKMDVGETIGVLIMALVLSFLATLFPAWKAAKTDPVEALRYE